MFQQSNLKFRILTIIVLVFGAVLRVENYLDNESLWLDEVNVSMSVYNHTFGELLFGQQTDQSEHIKPPLFAVALKLFSIFGGIREYAFRAFPFICSLFSLVAFYFLAKCFLKNGALLFAAALFSFSGPLIHYAAEVNTYSSDVLCALLIFYYFYYLSVKNFPKIHILGWVLMVAWLHWLSYASIIIMIALSAILVIELFHRRAWSKMVYGFCCFIFLTLNLYTLKKVAFNPMLNSSIFQKDRAHHYLVGDVFSFEKFVSLWTMFLEYFGQTLGLVPVFLTLSIFLISLFFLCRQNDRAVLVLIGPVFLVLICIYFGFYPIFTRTLIFLTPAVYIILSAVLVREELWSNRGLLLQIPMGIMLGSILFSPLKVSAYNFVENSRDGDRELLKVYEKEGKSEDIIVTSEYGLQIFLFYGIIEGFWPEKISDTEVYEGDSYHVRNLFRVPKGFYAKENRKAIILIDHAVFFSPDFDKFYLFRGEKGDFAVHQDDPLNVFKGKRVWIFLSGEKSEMEEYVVELFGRQGKQLQKHTVEGRALYLYELS